MAKIKGWKKQFDLTYSNEKNDNYWTAINPLMIEDGSIIWVLRIRGKKLPDFQSNYQTKKRAMEVQKKYMRENPNG